MHSATRTIWVTWIAMLGYASLCGMLWMAR